MNTLDSRSLSYTDCFMQKFSAAGQFVYELLPSTIAGLGHDEDLFTIDIKPRESKGGEPNQHHINVARRNGTLVAEPPRLTIEAGDVVIWNTNDSSITGYVVRGEGKGGRFSSDALQNEAVYSHSFGIPGSYSWLDPHGGSASGVIEVQPVDASDEAAAARWREKLAIGTVITVSDKRVNPSKVKILVGQTVFWAIEKASGMAIADARLVKKTSDRPTETKKKK